jgi:hypothetical protein
VYVSAIGTCELTINGKPASDDVFAPNREADRYVTYEVADLLVPGRNCIGATAAGGWAAGQNSGWGTWRKHGLLRVACTAPANTTATLLLPIRDAEAVREGETSAAKARGVKLLGKVQHRGMSKMAFELGSGTYKFAAPMP